MDLKDKINKLSLQAQTTPLTATCDTNLLFNVLNEAEELINALNIIKEHPYEVAATLNYIKINKDNPKMLDYKNYSRAVKHIFSKEDFETLKEVFKND